MFRLNLTPADNAQTLRALIHDKTRWRVHSSCNGAGICGLCRVRIIEGKVSPPTMAESMQLTATELQAGWRLSCQTRLQGDSEIEFDAIDGLEHWCPLSLTEAKIDTALPLSHSCNAHWGIAIDVGTTHIRMALLDLTERVCRIATTGRNIQACHGADVLSRLSAAEADTGTAHLLSELLVDSLGNGIQSLFAHLCLQENREQYLHPEITQCNIVGNTAMLSLLTQTPSGELLAPENWQTCLPCHPKEAKQWHARWQLSPSANLDIVQPLGGFVGSDLLASILATRLCESQQPALLIDVGTNTELALWDGHRLWVTATPGGPAFEGVGISCGMPAETGALYRLELDVDGNLQGKVLGNTKAQGICGSALIDAVAILLGNGDIHPSGRFNPNIQLTPEQSYPLHGAIALKSRDIDALQRAKAAIAAAAYCLLAKAGLTWQELTVIHLCGAFGHHLHLAHGQAIGLLPELPSERFAFNPHAALVGAIRLQLEPAVSPLLDNQRKHAILLNLSMVNEFEDAFIDHLRLHPISMLTNSHEHPATSHNRI